MQARRRRLTHDPNPAKRRFPLPVDPAVAGSTRITQRELERKLGAAAFQVWMELCTVRDSAGRTHVTHEGLSRMRGFDPLPLTKVKRGMAKLIEAGIVEPIGWQERAVPHGWELRTTSVFMRRVRGAPLPPDKDGVARAVFPRQVVAWLTRQNGWGGKRAGAGRKPGAARTLEPNQDAPTSIQDAPTSPESRCPPDMSTNKQEGKHRVEPSPSEKAARPSAAPLVDDDGTSLAGSSTGVSRALFSPLVPPRPVIATPRVPAPPELETDEPDDIARTLARAYRGGVEHVWPGTKTWAFRGEPRAWKNYAMLVTAGRAMREHRIAPAAWVLWSSRMWQAQQERSGAPQRGRTPHPPVVWMFSPKRIEERRGWFKSEDDTMGGRLVPGPRQRALVQRYARMMLDLGAPDAHADEVVARWFPPGAYERQLEGARREAAEMQTLIERQVRDGEWLW